MNYGIQSDTWKIEVSTLGAELQSAFHCPSGTEVLWQGDAAFWARQSPVLFPNVGKLKNNVAQWQGKTLSLPQHGFARDLAFVMHHQTDHSLVFRLTASESTWELFPADFQLDISYSLIGNTLKVAYLLANPGDAMLVAGLGAHPAFRCPIATQTSLEDYCLSWEVDEVFVRNELCDGLLTGARSRVETTDRTMNLSEVLFEQDALVFDALQSRWVELHPHDRSHVLRFSWDNFRSFGVWKKCSAPFLCLEPWNGHADFEATSGTWEEKPGMIRLAPGETHRSHWTIAFDTQ